MAGHTESDESDEPVMKEKKPDYCTQQGSHSDMKEKSKALQASKFSTSQPALQQMLKDLL